MTASSLTAWQERLGLNKSEAAIALGISRNTLNSYLCGRYPIPKYIGLACAAIAHGLPEIQ